MNHVPARCKHRSVQLIRRSSDGAIFRACVACYALLGKAAYVRDTNPGARAVSVPCLVCGRMLRLCDALIDPDGPPFRAYYHEACVLAREVPIRLGEGRRLVYQSGHHKIERYAAAVRALRLLVHGGQLGEARRLLAQEVN